MLDQIVTTYHRLRRRHIIKKLFARVRKLPSYFADAALDRRIQALPQELQDDILNFTLMATLPPRPLIERDGTDQTLRLCSLSTPDLYGSESWDRPGPIVFQGDRVVYIDEDYAPPAALQINRKTRRNMQEIFYSDTVFFLFGDISLANSWEGSMRSSCHHLDFVYVYHIIPLGLGFELPSSGILERLCGRTKQRISICLYSHAEQEADAYQRMLKAEKR
jgi:hypothetical protein